LDHFKDQTFIKPDLVDFRGLVKAVPNIMKVPQFTLHAKGFF
jgi:hypothetical protein